MRQQIKGDINMNSIAWGYILIQILFCIYIIAISWIIQSNLMISIISTILASFGIIFHMLLVLVAVKENNNKNITNY